jgi:hypothetical protein
MKKIKKNVGPEDERKNLFFKAMISITFGLLFLLIVGLVVFKIYTEPTNLTLNSWMIFGGALGLGLILVGMGISYLISYGRLKN